jgi:hypothetical protein
MAAVFVAVVMTVFLVFIGIAMRATLRAPDPERRQVCYDMFCRLLDVFRPGNHS